MQNQSTKQSFMLGRAHKIMCSDSNCKMQNENSKVKNFEIVRIFSLNEKESPEKFTKIYPKGKGEDSSRGFRFERTREIN